MFLFKNVAVVNAAVLGMGLLTSSGPQSWHPAHQCIKEACKGAADYCQVITIYKYLEITMFYLFLCVLLLFFFVEK